MYKRLFLFGLISTIQFFNAFSQEIVTKENAPKSLIKVYNKGENFLKSGKVNKAVACYEKAIKKEPLFIDPFLRLGGIAYENGDFKIAVNYFKEARNLSSTYDPRVNQVLALTFEKIGNLDSALVYLNYFKKSLTGDALNDVSKRIEQIEFIKKTKAHPVDINPEKLPFTINSTQYSEYLPSLTADGNTMFFTRVTNNQEDLYYTFKNAKGEWVEARLMPNINTYENEGAHCISADGKTIVFTFCSDGRTGKPRGCNLYISYLNGNQWSSPEWMSINSNSWDAQPNLSADGRNIIFASRRSGGQGGTDLWKSSLQDDGEWSIPKNLGKPINTSGNEESPFQHGKYLFFKSDSHLGLGSFDLFKSNITPDGNWSEPENLGFPINTEAHEGAMVISLDGTRAYYAKGAGDMNFDKTQTDIYTFILPDHLKPDPIGFIEFNVSDGKSLLPLSVAINLQSSDNENVVLDSFYTDREGYVLIPLPVGKNYSFIINEPGYYLYSDRIELTKSQTIENAFRKEISLFPIEKEKVTNAPTVLKNVLFESGSFKLLEESYFELNQLASLLIENPEFKIEIRGHTDNVGEEDDNLELSENRAKTVYNYLISKGINAERLHYKGFGENDPMATNDTEEGKSLNRRTEFIIIN